MDAKMAVTNVWCATIHQTRPPIIARIAQSSRKWGGDASSQASKATPSPTPPAIAPAAPGPPTNSEGSTTTSGASTAVTEPESYDLGKEFDYKGKYEGKVYSTHSANSYYNFFMYPRKSHMGKWLSDASSS
jgi:hypothetical protein